MKGLLVNAGAALGLFVAALFAALAATGRLDHDGVANIPLLNGLFPAAPAAGDDAAKARGDHGATAADAPASGGGRAIEDAAHVGAGRERAAQDPPGPDDKPVRLKKGRSLTQPDDRGPDDRARGEHGAGEQGRSETHGGNAAAIAPAKTEHAAPESRQPDAPEQDFAHLEHQLAQERVSHYTPGGYFRFDGMPAGITPDKLDEAWRRVQEAAQALERRQQALDLREQDLRLLADDVARRQTELGKERAEVESLQLKLDERIERFKGQVKLVRSDEVAGLKRNAQTIASFEPAKAAELLQEQWKLESGQDELLKTMEFMDKDAVNAIIAALPNGLIREVLQKRLRVSKEPAPAAPGR